MKPLVINPVNVFRAMGDELRLAMLLLIHDQGKLCVCEVTEAFDTPQPKVSRHLATLRDAGLLSAERRGQWVYYYLNPAWPDWLLRVVEETATSNRALIERPLVRLERMADRPMRCS